MAHAATLDRPPTTTAAKPLTPSVLARADRCLAVLKAGAAALASPDVFARADLGSVLEATRFLLSNTAAYAGASAWADQLRAQAEAAEALAKASRDGEPDAELLGGIHRLENQISHLIEAAR